MSKTTFTPGKWVIEKNNDNDLHLIWSDEEIPTLVARTCFLPHSESNAALIAAAPAMYELLLALSEEPTFYNHYPTAMKSINSLIQSIRQ